MSKTVQQIQTLLSSKPEDGLTLQEKLRNRIRENLGITTVPNSSALLLDVSSSMGGFHKGGVSKIDELRKVASNFKDIRRFTFGTWVEELPPNREVGYPSGSTAMHLAFDECHAKGINHAIVITDGEPDSEPAALAAAKGLKIDVFYVGPEPAPPFLARLANQTGGQFGKASLQDPKQLTAQVRGLLPAPSIGPKAIAL